MNGSHTYNSTTLKKKASFYDRRWKDYKILLQIDLDVCAWLWKCLQWYREYKSTRLPWNDWIVKCCKHSYEHHTFGNSCSNAGYAQLSSYGNAWENIVFLCLPVSGTWNKYCRQVCFVCNQHDTFSNETKSIQQKKKVF